MARAGLGPNWRPLFANDIDPAKAQSYENAWGGQDFQLGDISALSTSDLPGQADLAWASFPCQDLSLAGGRKGLSGGRSGMFWVFWRLIEGLRAEGRAPAVIAIENVVGLLTSNQGADFAALADAIASAGYCFSAFVIDAAEFVPQSRPRLFIVAFRDDVSAAPSPSFHPPALARATAGVGAAGKAAWRSMALPTPNRRNTQLVDILEREPDGVRWHNDNETFRLLQLMAPLHRSKVAAKQSAGGRHAGTVFRRTRRDANGESVQRAEARFDGLAGCLRTPAGGSSRQVLLLIEDGQCRSRLLSPREALRLMGLSDDYPAPKSLNAALKLAGDGVAAPVVRYLAETVFEPYLAERMSVAA